MRTQHTAAEHGINFDRERVARIGLPEAVFCEGKSRTALCALLRDCGSNPQSPILFTRLAPSVFCSMPKDIQSQYDYHELSRTAFSCCLPMKKGRSVAVVSAGTADGPITWEAARTLEYLGIETRVYEDCGVAGLWRLLAKLEDIDKADVVIAVAGLDAALVSVLGGLTGKPLFAVPSPVGYGVAKDGEAALASMLASCAPGVGVMNIGNGYGAACAAARIIHHFG